MQAFLDSFLKGKKTYIVAGLFLLFQSLYLFGVVDAEFVTNVNAFLLPLGLAFLRAGVGAVKNDTTQ